MDLIGATKKLHRILGFEPPLDLANHTHKRHSMKEEDPNK
jgi:hypothetical protein